MYNFMSTINFAQINNGTAIGRQMATEHVTQLSKFIAHKLSNETSENQQAPINGFCVGFFLGNLTAGICRGIGENMKVENANELVLVANPLFRKLTSDTIRTEAIRAYIRGLEELLNLQFSPNGEHTNMQLNKLPVLN